ncbi:MAG: hypothetical protein U0527_04915 [Candidatus Eisenbacteria bacterium]
MVSRPLHFCHVTDDVINVLDLIKVVRLILGPPAPRRRGRWLPMARYPPTCRASPRGSSMSLAGAWAGAEIALDLPPGARGSAMRLRPSASLTMICSGTWPGSGSCWCSGPSTEALAREDRRFESSCRSKDSNGGRLNSSA